MPSTFSVYLNGQLWIGVLELIDADVVRAARHVFGSEPGGPELMEFVRHDFLRLLDSAQASPPVEADIARRVGRINPKRLARLSAREQATRPVSTAAQDALSRAYAQRRTESRTAAKRNRAADAEERRTQAREKARQRHRGR